MINSARPSVGPEPRDLATRTDTVVHGDTPQEEPGTPTDTRVTQEKASPKRAVKKPSPEKTLRQHIAHKAHHALVWGDNRSTKAHPSSETSVSSSSSSSSSNRTRTTDTRATVDGPRIPAFSDWATSAEAVQARSDLDVISVIRQRGKLLGDLIYDLGMNDTDAVTKSLQQIPSSVEQFDSFFPPLPPDEPTYYQSIQQMAVAYHQEHNTAHSERLVQFFANQNTRLTTVSFAQESLQDVPQVQIDKAYAPEVQALCVALRDTGDALLPSTVDRLQPLMEKALARDLKEQSLATELARQPYANLRMMMLKCMLLSTHMDSGLVFAFREQIKAAIEMQTHVSDVLREQLLKGPVDEAKVASLALVEYAKQMTSLAVDYVSAGATWKEVDAVNEGIEEVYVHYAGLKETHGLEEIALRWVTRQIQNTLREAH